MTRGQSDNEGFWKTSFRKKTFWLCVLALFLGTGFSAWFNLRVVGFPPESMVIGMPFAFLIGMAIVLYIFHREYSGKENHFLPRDAQGSYDRTAALREVIATIPLLPGIVVALYFLATLQFSYVVVVLMASLGLWQLLRFLLRRKRRRPL